MTLGHDASIEKKYSLDGSFTTQSGTEEPEWRIDEKIRTISTPVVE